MLVIIDMTGENIDEELAWFREPRREEEEEEIIYPDMNKLPQLQIVAF